MFVKHVAWKTADGHTVFPGQRERSAGSKRVYDTTRRRLVRERKPALQRQARPTNDEPLPQTMFGRACSLLHLIHIGGSSDCSPRVGRWRNTSPSPSKKSMATSGCHASAAASTKALVRRSSPLPSQRFKLTTPRPAHPRESQR